MSDTENGHFRPAPDTGDVAPSEVSIATATASGTEIGSDTEPDTATNTETDTETPETAGVAELSESSDTAEPEPESESESDSEAEAAPKSRRGSSETLESEAEIAADYLEELLDIADLDGDIDTYIEGDRAHVSIVSDTDVLVGPHGAVLDALQELARLAVMTETGERSRLMLDVAGFREKRRSELIVLATDAVQEVKSSQEKVPLAPMNPFERKIVHDAVAAAGLTSASEGEEPKRHVVVLPVG